MSISNEELLIRTLVDEIYKIEEKINLLNESLNNDNIKNKIENLKNIKNNLIQQKLSINNSFLLESKNNSDDLQKEIDKIKNIENNLESKKNELVKFNVLSFQCIPLKKYILSNKSKDFLTEAQINELIFDGQFPSSNPEIKKLKREIEINKASEYVIINNIKEIKSKIEQIKENIKMLKEEKGAVKVELINLISCKETLEQIIKININNLNIYNKALNKKKISDNENAVNNKWTEPIELYFHELCIIDTKKSANNLCNDLFELFNLNNDGTKKAFKNNNDLNTEKLRKKHMNLFSYYTLNGCHDYKNNILNHNKNKSDFNISNLKLNKSKFNNEIQYNNNYSNIYVNSFIFNKNGLCSLIQNEIENYVSGKINSYKTISEFLENLSILITSNFQYIDIIISSDSLTIYLSYFFKSLYYESIANCNIKFINRDYKARKKEYKNLIVFLQNEISKLETKNNEYKSKTKIVEKQIELVKKENFSKKKNKPLNLTLEEQNYILICSKANGLLKKKKNIKETINEYQNKYNELKIENDSKISQIDIEINKINKKLITINEDFKNNKLKVRENIDYHQRMINEKYNIIKTQLLAYKNKYGSNLDIYNRLIKSINDTIKKTYEKPALIIINNNNNINNSHIFNDEMGKILQNKSINNNTNEQVIPKKNKFISSTSNKLFHAEKKMKLTNNNNNKSSLNIEFDNSIISNSGLNNNLKRNNTYISNNRSYIRKIQNKHKTIIKKDKIRKFNSKRKLNKVLNNLNNLSYILNSNDKSLSINKEEKKKLIKKKNNSLIYNVKYIKNKTFTNDTYDKIKDNSEYNYKSKFNILSLDNNNLKNEINSSNNNIFNKYHHYKSNSINNKSKILNNTNISNNKYISNKINYKFKNKTNILFISTNKKKYELKQSTSSDNQKFTIPQKNNLNNYKNIFRNNHNKSQYFYEKEKDILKLSNITINLKDKINKDEINIKEKILEKIQPLTKLTFCYFREYNDNLLKYNPFINISSEVLCQEQYNFTNATISLTKKYDILRISPFGNFNKIDFNILDIENILINSKIKLLIEIHRNYRKFKEFSSSKLLDDFVNSQVFNYPQLTREEIEKCAKNRNFNFSLIINEGKIFELIICSYQEFKIWLNGISFLVKNKNEIIRIIKEMENSNSIIT